MAQVQPQGKNPFEALITKYGVTVDFEQLVHLDPISTNEFWHQHIDFKDYSAVIFTSKMAIDCYFHLCHELRYTVPTSMCYFCSSEIIANYLQKYIECRKRKIFYGTHHTIAELVEQIVLAQQKHNFLLVSSDIPNIELVTALEQNNIPITSTILYHTTPLDWPKDRPFEYDMIVVFSPNVALALKHNFPRLPATHYTIAAMGKNTIQTLEQCGYKVPIQAPTEQCPSIFQAIDNFLAQTNK